MAVVLLRPRKLVDHLDSLHRPPEEIAHAYPHRRETVLRFKYRALPVLPHSRVVGRLVAAPPAAVAAAVTFECTGTAATMILHVEGERHTVGSAVLISVGSPRRCLRVSGTCQSIKVRGGRGWRRRVCMDGRRGPGRAAITGGGG